LLFPIIGEPDNKEKSGAIASSDQRFALADMSGD
jgi:hypothetical protein